MPGMVRMGARAWAVGLGLLLVLLAIGYPGAAGGQQGTGGVNDADVIRFINEQIQQGWKENKITPAKEATEYEFLRRVFLDVIGRIPSHEEIQMFNRMPVSSRRSEIIEYLLVGERKGQKASQAQGDYANNWANLWTVWMLTRTSPPGVDRERMHGWLAECFSLNKPWDKMVHEVLTASGKANENGPVNFILSHMGERVPDGKRGRDGLYEMVPVTSRTTKLFLGVQTQCTQCHDHPFIDTRKQQQYWGVNAFFRQVSRSPDVIDERRNRDSGMYYTLSDDLQLNMDGGIYFERRNGLLLLARPTYLDGTKVPVNSELNRRDALSRLMLKDEHFAKAFVNRMWAHFFGRGFTNPVDDFGEHNAVSHPELLDRLAQDFTYTGYDVHRLIRWITNSRPYQLSSVSNKTNEKPDAEPFFSRMLLKSMTPEQLVDSIFMATNSEKAAPNPEEKRRMYEQWLRAFTVNFGDDEGNEATFNGTVVQALMMMNGPLLNEAIKPKQGGTLQAMARHTNNAKRLEFLFLCALTRPPTSREIQEANKILAVGGKEPTAPWQDILWALLNSNEFILNY
jgi:hypothetical protein